MIGASSLAKSRNSGLFSLKKKQSNEYSNLTNYRLSIYQQQKIEEEEEEEELEEQ